MEIKATCPECGRTLPVDSDACGRQINCPVCSKPFIIPPFKKPDAEKIPDGRQRRMAVDSMILGILSLVLPCVGFIFGIPAVICGHIAHHRARKFPTKFAGSGMAIAGFVMGYLGVLASSFILFSVLGATQRYADAANSVNNLKEIGLAFKIWEGDHNGQFPFNVSQTNGGTMELCRPDRNGFEQNPVPTFAVMSNELAVTKILVCHNDHSKHIADNFGSLTAANISYQLRTGTNINDNNPQEILAIDPINGLALHCDGSVEQDFHYKKNQK